MTKSKKQLRAGKEPFYAILDDFGRKRGWWRHRFLDGHVHIGKNVTVYGRNAMHWGVDVYRPRKGDYLCFRLPLPCFGKWWPMGCYISPNATPWAATKWFWGSKERSC